jgi:hypothetical protein
VIRGVLGRVAGDRINGWAFDDRNPDSRLTVRVRLGKRELGRTEASIPRTDLQKLSGAKEPAHGYKLAVPLSLTESERAELVVEAARPGGKTWRELPRHRPPPVSDPPAAEPDPSLVPRAAGKFIEFVSDQFWTDSADRPPVDDGTFPVFVLGAARSGTSALFSALTQATRYRGFREGHLLDIAARLDADIAAHIKQKQRRQPADAIAVSHLARDPHARLRGGLKVLLRVAADGYTTPYWIDKTPSRDIIRSAPLLAETWPNARFIFMKRRGIENVMSRLRKFPGLSFRNHCILWASIMSDWRKIRPSLTGKFVEIEQRGMLEDPAGAAAAVAALIGLGEPEIDRLAAQLQAERPQVTDPSGQVVADIAETGWSVEMIDTFRTVCSREMATYGYSWDASYVAAVDDKTRSRRAALTSSGKPAPRSRR